MSGHRYILALDQGTTSSRAILFDRSGVPVAPCAARVRADFPQPGWVEHDPHDIWASAARPSRIEVLRKAGASSARIVAAIGITNQRETTLALGSRDAASRSHNAIVWQDRRTARASATSSRRRAASAADPAQDRPGDRRLLLRHQARSGCSTTCPARARAPSAASWPSALSIRWLIWRLTGGAVHVTDYSNAIRTLLFNIHTLRLGRRPAGAASAFRAPMLPEVRASSGASTADATRRCSARALPIAGIAGDQQAATFGQACFEPGMAKNTYGTGCFMLMNTGAHAGRRETDLLSRRSAGGSAATATYCLEGSVFIAGAAIQWLRDGLGIIDSAPEIEALAAQCPTAAASILVPAFAGLGAPLLGPLRARRDPRADARHGARAHRPRRARRDRVADARRAGARWRPMRASPLSELRVDGGASAIRPADADSRPTCSASRRAARRDRNDRARRGLPRRT